MRADDAGPRRVGIPGLKILIVEDEAIVSFLIEDMLRELGFAAVWHAGSVRQAVAQLDVSRPDVVLLDVNLGGELVFPVAERLEAESIPFVFATGYGRQGIPPAYSCRPVIQKPFDIEALALVLESVLTGTEPPGE